MKTSKIGIIICLGIVLLLSCNQEKTFSLDGTIDRKYDGHPVVLFTFKADSVRSADTTIIKNGEFNFQGKEYLDDYSILSIGNYPNQVLYYELLLEKGNIKMSFEDDKVQGTPLNDLHQLYLDSISVLGKNLTYINGATLHDGSLEKINAFTTKFKKQNVGNIVGQKIIIEELGKRMGENSDTILHIIDSYKDTRLANHPDVVRHRQSVEEDKKTEADRSKSISMLYTDFELRTPKGDVTKLSDYVGKSKYLFIEFWASWCAPCIADVPNVKKAYEKYRSEGLEVISISLDDVESNWLNALKKIDAPWTHLSDLKGIPSALTESYHIRGIPYSVLLDQDGNIVYTNLRGAVLEIIMEEVVKINE